MHIKRARGDIVMFGGQPDSVAAAPAQPGEKCRAQGACDALAAVAFQHANLVDEARRGFVGVEHDNRTAHAHG
tara:strand:- start:251 stop:469 length:219 start_codon:yes stop_codon:yes gene_type:complete